MESDYESYEDILSDLFRFKNQCWCQHCERRLFFPKTCTIHSDDVEPEDVDSIDSDVSDEGDIMIWEVMPRLNLNDVPGRRR
jgi:hypothetical protein